MVTQRPFGLLTCLPEKCRSRQKLARLLRGYFSSGEFARNGGKSYGLQTRRKLARSLQL
jgi:hypothetical protein